MQIKNKLNNLIVSTFLLLFVNKIMLVYEVLFFCSKSAFFVKWVLFLLKMCFFFLGRVLFLSAFFAKVHHDPWNMNIYL